MSSTCDLCCCQPSFGKGHSKECQEYQICRKKNNDAVKRSREKLRKKCCTLEDRIECLTQEQEELERKIEILESVYNELLFLYNVSKSAGITPPNPSLYVYIERYLLRRQNMELGLVSKLDAVLNEEYSPEMNTQFNSL